MTESDKVSRCRGDRVMRWLVCDPVGAGSASHARNFLSPRHPPSVLLGEPAIGDAVMEEGAYGAVTQDDLDVVAADGVPPPLIINVPGILNALDRMAPVALVQRDR